MAETLQLKYCPRCGITLTTDTSVEKRFGVQAMLCPAENIRFTYIEATEVLHMTRRAK